MKSAVLVFLSVFFLSASKAQNCDIATTGVAVVNGVNTAPVPLIGTNQNTNFQFSIFNAGTDPGCTIPANTVSAIFDFPTIAGGIKPYIYDGPATFVSGYFTWTYISVDEVLSGTNTTAIPNGLGDVGILVKIKGNASGIGHSNLNLTQGVGISDNVGNNTGTAQLVVVENAALPVKLSSFTAVPDNCNILLRWSTKNEESNFSHFEKEYSTDSRTFIKVGTVQGKGISTGADYKLSYRQLNGNGYYRLKQVDKDGRFEYSQVIIATTNCSDKSKVLIYPNPLRYDEKLVVTISGYTGKIKGELFNATGQKVTVYSLVNSANELSISNLSSGMYMLSVKGENGESVSFKVVVTR